MKLFNFNKSVVGIDLGSRNIKAVKIQHTLKGPKVVALAVRPIPTGALKQGLFLDPNAAVNLMRELIEEIGGALSAFLAFSGQNTIVREIELPVMNDKELLEAIHWEAEKVLPYPVEEAVIDWVVLERNRDTDQMMTLLLVAGRKDYIRAFLKPVKTVGIQPLNLSVFPMPVLHVLQLVPDFTHHAAAAVIDMGAEATHVLIMKDGLPRLNRTIATGGNDFTETVAHSFSIPLDEAEKVKLEYGGLDIPEIDLSKMDLASNPYLGIEEVLSNMVQDVFSEIKRSFVHFQLHNRGQLIEKVYLTGGASQLKGMPEHLSKFLNVSVEVLHLRSLIPFDSALSETEGASDALITEALGLALSEVK